MKKIKRFFALFLALLMLFPTDLSVYAAEASLGDTAKKEVRGSETITRAQWLEKLTIMFDMMIESDDMPDNYFSDLEADSEYYEALMLAVEFGVVDIEAGGEIRPNDPCTREFAASTLNYCLGFQLEDGFEYSFSDAEDCVDPESAQIAVNRGWFVLDAENAFAPEQFITAAEAAAMEADAEKVLESVTVDDDYNSSYVFADYVVEIPEGTDVVIDENDIVTITDSTKTIKGGDTFVVYPSELPSLYLAENVVVDGNSMTIVTGEADESSAIVSIDASGSVDVDLSQFEEAEGVEATYIRTAADAASAVQLYGISVEKDSVIATKEIEVGKGVKASIVVNLSDLALEHNIQTLKGNYYVAVTGTSTITGDVSVDMVEALGGSKNVVIGTVRVMGIGEVTVSVDLQLDGQVVVTYTGDFESGVQYKRNDGFRLVTSFKKKKFSTDAEANAKIGVKVLFGVDIIAASADIWATTGLAANFVSHAYGDGKTPNNCTNISAWLYASVGANAKLGIGKLSKSFSKTKEIYKQSNSPVFVSFHWEDSEQVFSCARENMTEEKPVEQPKYFTPADSPYGTSSYGGGKSTGINSAGESYELYTYKVDGQNATITGYFGNASVVKIPSTIDGYTVTEIGRSAFEENYKISVVIIPDTVVKINKFAFSECISLETVRLSKNIKEIANKAFYACSMLREIKIPASLEDAGGHEPNSMYADTGAFHSCNNLKTVHFEEGTTRVASGLLAHCFGLEKIVLPDTITEIGPNAFYKCTALKSVKLSENLEEIKSSAFEKCESLSDIELPDSVKKIGIEAFYQCANLENVKLSKNIVEIGSDAFYECNGLTNIFIPKSLELAGSHLMENKGAFHACENLKTVTFEEGTTVVADYLFSMCTGLEEIVLPDTITEIGSHAFYRCSALKSVTMSKNLLKIRSNAFEDCKALVKIEIPDRVELIAGSVFKDCISLNTVKMPKSLKEIGMRAFENVTALTAIEIPQSVEKIGSYAFYGCSKLASVNLPYRLQSLSDYMFHSCESLKSIQIPHNIKIVGDFSFMNCTNLEDVSLGANVSTINNGAFKNCTSLKIITMPQSVKTINNLAFANINTLTIYGVSGTAAESFANTKGYKFVATEVPAASVTLSDSRLALLKDETHQLYIKDILPLKVTDKVTWSTSDEKVATVSKDGFVKCRKIGTAMITVTVGNVSATCEVNGVGAVTDVFTDVAEGKWYVEAVQYVYNSGLMSGNNGKFNPTQDVTRAQLLTTLYRMAGSPKVTDYRACDEFADVKANTYYTDAVCWAYSEGIATGNPATQKFNTTGTLARQQLAAFLYRYAEYKGYNTEVRGDISGMLNQDKLSAYAIDNMKWAVGAGLISGSKMTDAAGNTVYDLAPQSGTTRAQLATILMRYCELYQ